MTLPALGFVCFLTMLLLLLLSRKHLCLSNAMPNLSLGLILTMHHGPVVQLPLGSTFYDRSYIMNDNDKV